MTFQALLELYIWRGINKMALILKRPIQKVKCWVCDLEITGDEAMVVFKVGKGLAYAHANCAGDIGIQITRDLCQLSSLDEDTLEIVAEP